ncbi:Mannan endo-1,4-beta-mannosidase 1 [Tetrabaena socialis]|uniref:mannan endo-1,4-beta-mannosidase n=1 Tax=Tetrabaena socialis TaxID=47790 RepID=A0A2J8AHF7_9CHLO|nr:Mannan endo-1,4-beta-mannosidase 1 [Tetrabaena socialis]|eukprot:PNH11950.1 Mannan endo-1,4-beta-mannosidase 1 [Tetrabaena socialis]
MLQRACAVAPLLFAPLLLAALAGLPVADASFVQRCGSHICVDNVPWYFQGANAYWLIDFVQKDRGMVDRFFDACNQFGLKVIRTWAFNHRMPYAWGKYDEGEFQGLDYIVDSAGRHNIRLILALGNTWTAYRSPQDYLRMAGVDPATTDLLGFYNSSQLRHFYKDHISAIVWRTNTFNGRRYREDDAVMMYDAMNEPRCPGCMDAASQAIHHSFLQEMATHLRGQAPYQLIALGTEGYFMNTYEGWNSGAGARCEGEDWVTINSKITAIDVTVVHVYERQMESVPPAWGKCNFTCFVNYMIQTLTDFLRGPERAVCAAAAAKWWLPIWTAPWAQTVDVAAYQRRCQDMTVLQVFLDTSKLVYG